MRKKVLKSKDLSSNVDLKEKVKKGPSAGNVDLLPANGSGVLNKKVLDARGRAQSIIEEAKNEALKTHKEAKELLSQVESELAKAKERGYQEGKEEGFSSVTELVAAFEDMKDKFYANAEENIVELVMMVSEKVIGKIVQENSETIKSIVKQALESVLGDRILIRINPADYKVLKASEAEFQNLLDRTRRITFKEDETIVQGGCMVETEVGTIDARLETQLKAIRKAFEL